MMQAYTRLQRHKNALKCISEAEKLNKSYKKVGINTNYFKKNEIVRQKMEMDSILHYQSTVLKIKQNSISEAQATFEKQNTKKNSKNWEAYKILGSYLQKKTT